jgi:F-type H+-transporting ATPase subunit a
MSSLMAVVLAGVAPDAGSSGGDSPGFWEWLFSSSPFHAPTIAEFYPDAIWFEGTIFEFNQITFVRIVSAIVIVGLFATVASRARIVPGRSQALVEMILDFIRVQVVEQVMGKEEARRFTAFLTTLFIAIFFFNVTGVIPFLNISATSLIGLPLVMAAWVYLLYLGAGIKRHGLWHYLRISLFPPGIPWLVYIFITPIEFAQVFFLRPATLTLRLTANMISGHLLLVLCFAGTHALFFEASGAVRAMGAMTLLAGILFTLFEIFVAVLQAYIFVMLSAVYFHMAIADEH